MNIFIDDEHQSPILGVCRIYIRNLDLPDNSLSGSGGIFILDSDPAVPGIN
jgi:hypothetical protein